VCGVTPAWILSSALEVGFADDSRTSSEGATQGRFRRGFVAAQIGVAFVLLVAMILTVRSVGRLQAVNPGFEGGKVLSLQLALPTVRYATPAAIVTFADTLTADLTSLPAVREPAAISLLPLSGLLSTQDYRVVGKPEPSPDEIPQAHYRIVTPRYFRVMGIPIRGREFDDTDRETTRRVAVISRTFANRHWPGASPVGEHVLIGPDSLEIVGVCADVKQFGLDGTATADLYVPLRQMPANQAQFVAGRMYWVVETFDDPMKAADPVRAAVRRLDKDVATSSIRPIPVVLTASMGSRRFNTDLIGVAGAASLLLAVIGVYSVTSFSMTRRTREIGIRLTLGARPGQVLVTVLAAEWRPIALGLAVGALGGVITARALGSVLFATSGVEPLIIGVAAVALGVAALVASYVPARRAIRTDPVAALRVQ